MDRELRRRLKSVDPDLRIVSFRPPHKIKKQVSTETMNEEDWELAAGDPCPKCGRLDVRFIKGMCRECYHAAKTKLAKQEASLNPIIRECKDKRLASRIQRYMVRKDRTI